MVYELNEIKQIRKGFGLTQSDLARMADVSQSLIAKIESNRIDPTYSKTKKIFEALDNLSKKEEIKAEEIMNKNIISLRSDDSIKDAIKKMKKHAISQMPIIEDNNAVGFVSEAVILDSLMQQKGEKVKDIMQDSPPVVSKQTNINLISNLLKFYPIVIISENGKLRGVITKSDVLKVMYKK